MTTKRKRTIVLRVSADIFGEVMALVKSPCNFAADPGGISARSARPEKTTETSAVLAKDGEKAMTDIAPKFRVERTGFGDTRLILDDLGDIVGLAVQMANGAWGAFDEDANRRLTM